jgi:hypothetical protein
MMTMETEKKYADDDIYIFFLPYETFFPPLRRKKNKKKKREGKEGNSPLTRSVHLLFSE